MIFLPETIHLIQKQARGWVVIDPAGQLVCITLYKHGAEEVVRRLGRS